MKSPILARVFAIGPELALYWCNLIDTFTLQIGVNRMTALVNEEYETIGAVAGCIWNYLNEQGPVTLTQLVKQLDVPRDAVMQGVGWLAREGKVTITKETRSRKISLT